MNRRFRPALTVLLMTLVLSTAGCGALFDLLTPTTVRVVLVNESTDFGVEGTLYYDDEDDIPELLLTELGEEMSFTLAAGQTQSFIRSCDDLQAIIIDDADLQVIGSVGPEDSSEVQRIDDDYACGDDLVFRFSHTGAIVDFRVTFSAE